MAAKERLALICVAPSIDPAKILFDLANLGTLATTLVIMPDSYPADEPSQGIDRRAKRLKVVGSDKVNADKNYSPWTGI